jgi:hypothetical protein
MSSPEEQQELEDQGVVAQVTEQQEPLILVVEAVVQSLLAILVAMAVLGL